MLGRERVEVKGPLCAVAEVWIVEQDSDCTNREQYDRRRNTSR